MGLAFGFFGLVAGAGFVSGGGYAELAARSGTPLDMAARALGFGLDKVTISGLVQLRSAEILQAAGHRPAQFAALPQRGRRARPACPPYR